MVSLLLTIRDLSQLSRFLGAHKSLKRGFAFSCSATAASDRAASDFMQTEITPVIQLRNYSMQEKVGKETERGSTLT
jgi:hypothetical protein